MMARRSKESRKARRDARRAAVPPPDGESFHIDAIAASPRDPGILGRLRGYFLTGILVTAPIGITLYLAWVFLGFMDARITPLIPEAYNPNTYLPVGVPGLGLAVFIIALTIIGALTRLFIGRALLGLSEQLLRNMPVIRNIYGAIKQIAEALLAQKSEAFRQVVLVQYPRQGIWAIGFVTGTTKGEVQRRTEPLEVVNVFLPTTPNPTSGFLLFFPREDVIELDMTIEEGAKMIISSGIVSPPDRRAPGDAGVEQLKELADAPEAPANNTIKARLRRRKSDVATANGNAAVAEVKR